MNKSKAKKSGKEINIEQTFTIKGGTEALTKVLERSLPHVRKTGIVNHLAMIKPDIKSNGKAVNFKWQKQDFVLSASARVRERPFGTGCSVEKTTELSKEVEGKIRHYLAKEQERIEQKQIAAQKKLKEAEQKARKSQKDKERRAAKKAAQEHPVIEQEKSDVQVVPVVSTENLETV